MTARADVCVFLDGVPPVRAHRSDEGRVVLALDPVLTLFAPLDVMRATLEAAVAAIDAMEAGR